MAIDPTTTTTIRVGQLGSAAFNSTDLVPHEVSGTLKKGTLQDLATFIGSIISVDVSVGFRAVQVNDGETLPATDQQEFILVGPGTYPNVGGGATITTTGALNALVSNGVFWFIGVEIPIEVSAIWGDINGVLSDQTDLNDILVAKADLVGGKVPNSQLPSYVDDVIEVNDFASLPSTGETGKIYVTKDTGNIYRWSGSAYIRIADESPVWGIITGTLSDQTDLQNALDGKFDVPTGDTTQYIAGDGSLVTFPIAGQAGTLVRLVLNNSGSTIAKGSVVYINGASGNKPTIAKAIATGDSTSAQTFGLVQADITNNSSGYVVVSGDLIGLNTSAITEGTQLYLSSTTAGEYTTTKQYAPAHLVYVGVVTRSHATLGQIEVKIQNGYELDELHDVAISSKTNKDFLSYESSTNLWKNKSLGTILGGSSSQFLKGDGSLDSTVYLKGSLSANYIPRSLYPGSGDMTNSSIYDNTNGAIGIGVVPSDWDTAWKVLQISKGSYYASDYSNRMGYNLYEIGENTKYISSNLASLYEQNSGSHYWYTAPSGTAGANMTLTPRMILDNSGKLGIGTTSPSSKLQVEGQIRVNNTITGLSLNRPTTSNYNGIGFLTNGIGQWFLGMRENLGSNNLIAYSEVTGTDVLTLNVSTGNVGIGTTSPTLFTGYRTLALNDVSGAALELKVNDVSGLKIFSDSGSSYFYENRAVDIKFFNNATERMRITSGGTVLVNQTGLSTADAGIKMQVATDILSTGFRAGYFFENRSGGVTTNSNWYGLYATSGTIYMYNGSANIASINTSTGAYVPLSDINKKKDFEQSTIGLDAILGLKPTLYRIKTDDENAEKKLGFIAQEVKDFIPQAFIEQEGETENFIGLDYNSITAALVKAMQEQNVIIQELKAEIEILKNK